MPKYTRYDKELPRFRGPWIGNRDCGSVLGLSLGLNALLLIFLLFRSSEEGGAVVGTPRVWHGGHPTEARSGSCWCASDEYCMCTPSLSIDLVIASGKNSEHLWVVRRKDTDLLATMGGFVEVDETVEDAVRRELKEEMGVDLARRPKLLGLYEDPRRDNRRRTASAVYVVHFEDDEMRRVARPGDDAKEVVRIGIDDIEQHSYFADHLTILLDYRGLVRGESYREESVGDFSNDIKRSVCSETSSLVADGP